MQRNGSPGQEANEPLADANDADGDEDPALNEDSRQGLLVGHALGAIVAHHLHSSPNISFPSAHRPLRIARRFLILPFVRGHALAPVVPHLHSTPGFSKQSSHVIPEIDTLPLMSITELSCSALLITSTSKTEAGQIGMIFNGRSSCQSW